MKRKTVQNRNTNNPENRFQMTHRTITSDVIGDN